jgi:hypothetical protein
MQDRTAFQDFIEQWRITTEVKEAGGIININYINIKILFNVNTDN